MPIRIGSYEQQVRNTGADVGPSTQRPVTGSTNADAIADGAERVSRALNGLGEVFSREKQKADAFAATDRELQFANDALAILKDNEKGYLNTAGEKALDTKPVHEAIETARQKYMATLGTEEARREYDKNTRVRKLQLYDAVEEHAAKERVGFYASTTKAVIKEAGDAASLNYDNPDKIEDTITLALPKMTRYYKDVLGQSDAEVQSSLETFEAAVYEKALGEFLGRNEGIRGLAYLDAYGGEIRRVLGDQAAKWEQTFAPMAEKERGETEAEAAYRLSFRGGRPDLARMQETLQRRYKDGKIPLPVLDEALKRINSKNSGWETGFRQETANFWDQALSFWDRGGHDLTKVPSGLVGALQQRGQWHTLEQMDRNWHQQSFSMPPTREQRDAMLSLWWDGSGNPNMFDNMTDAEFKMRYLPGIAPNQQDDAIRYAASLRQRNEKGGAAQVKALSMLETLGRASGALPREKDGDVDPKDPSTWPEDQRDTYFVARKKLEERINEWMREHPKDPVPQDWYEPFLRDLFSKGYVGGKWFPDEKTKLEAATTGQEWRPDTEAIPEYDKNQIREAYQMLYHRDPSEDEIASEYWNSKKQPL